MLNSSLPAAFVHIICYTQLMSHTLLSIGFHELKAQEFRPQYYEDPVRFLSENEKLCY